MHTAMMSTLSSSRRNGLVLFDDVDVLTVVVIVSMLDSGIIFAKAC